MNFDPQPKWKMKTLKAWITRPFISTNFAQIRKCMKKSGSCKSQWVVMKRQRPHTDNTVKLYGHTSAPVPSPRSRPRPLPNPCSLFFPVPTFPPLPSNFFTTSICVWVLIFHLFWIVVYVDNIAKSCSLVTGNQRGNMMVRVCKGWYRIMNLFKSGNTDHYDGRN